MSDELNPVRRRARTVGDRGSSSEALHDHRAFQLWSRAALRADGVDRTRGLFAVPAELATLDAAAYDDDWRATSPWAAGDAYFQGLAIYDADDLRPAGNVSHLAPDFYASRSHANSRDSGGHVTRSLRRGDALFTFSDNTVLKTTLDGRDVLGAADLAADFDASQAAYDDDDDASYFGRWYW